MDRAYSLLTVKSLDAERRTFAGVASTPELDRHGDSLDVAGATFRNPVPLLWQHDQRQPLGSVHLTKADNAILFDASMPVVDTPGRLRDRLDEAWQSIKAGLITGVSIGFRVLEHGIRPLRNGGAKLTKTEIVELSLVTIPANTQASIRLVKSLAASGRTLPGVAGRASGRRPMTTAEQIKSFEETRATKAGAMAALMDAAGATGVTLDAAQTEEYDGLAAEVKAVDAHLIRLRDLLQTQAAAAQPVVVPAAQPRPPLPVPAPVPVIQVKANVPQGTAFVRYICAKVHCRGSFADAAEYAKRWEDTTPEVALALKAAVAPGTATDPAWAGPLVPLAQTMATDFIALLRPNTIIGRIPNLRQVPFNVRVPVQTGGGIYGWVGENKPKPASALAFNAVTLTWAKAAGIIVITKELARLSSPSAEMVVRNDMIAGIGQFLDQQFIDPTVTAVANVHPASITNGATTAASANDPIKDLNTLLGLLAAANVPLRGVTLILSETNAVALSLARSTLGVPLFPAMTATGGQLQGFNIVASQAAGTNVIAVQPDLVLFADEGGVEIDASEEASLQMDSAPMSPADATVVMTSLWQQNLIGLRAERFINWARGINAAVAYLTAANYTVVTPALIEAAKDAAKTSQQPPSAEPPHTPKR